MIIRKYNEKDLEEMIAIWNEVVEDGVAFPQEECLSKQTGTEFFAAQSYCGVAEDNGKVVPRQIWCRQSVVKSLKPLIFQA